MGFIVSPFFIERDPEKPFDVNKFFKECLRAHINLEEDDGYIMRAGSDLFNDLTSKTKLLQTPKRAAFTVPFQIGEGLTIGIQG